MTDHTEPPARTELITEDNRPYGCESYDLTAHANGSAVRLIGRRIAARQPCTRLTGCRGSDTLSVYRYPTTGLNLPGEPAFVGELRWCSTCGEVSNLLGAPSSQEHAWGWDRPSAV